MSMITIRPFLRDDDTNMGLTKAGMVIADGCKHSQAIACLDNNGIKTYINGLNEGAKAVQELPDDQRNAKMLDIRKTVVYLENNIAGNYDITEEDIFEKDSNGKNTSKFASSFWNKVTKFKAVWPDKFDNNNTRIPTYWDGIELKVGNEPVPLDQSMPYSVMLTKAIEAGGFGDLIAPSIDSAREKIVPPKFYMDRLENTAAIQVEAKKLRNQAGAKLQSLYEKDTDKLFYILKNIGTFPLGYRKSTPKDILYDDADKHLDGLGAEKNKRVAMEQFMELAKLDHGNLKLRAIAKDAGAMNVIAPKGDGSLYYIKNGTPIGKNFEDVIMYLNNPMNSKELLEITDIIEKEWNNN